MEHATGSGAAAMRGSGREAAIKGSGRESGRRAQRGIELGTALHGASAPFFQMVTSHVDELEMAAAHTA
jgi:hypothetical protein